MNAVALSWEFSPYISDDVNIRILRKKFMYGYLESITDGIGYFQTSKYFYQYELLIRLFYVVSISSSLQLPNVIISFIFSTGQHLFFVSQIYKCYPNFLFCSIFCKSHSCQGKCKVALIEKEGRKH